MEMKTKNNSGAKTKQLKKESQFVVVFKRFVYQANHRLHTAVLPDRAHFVPEYTDNARIFLKAADKACNNDVCNHRGKKGNGNAEEGTATRSAVDFCRIVVLLVDALQAAQKNENLEGERIPYDIDNKNGNVLPISRARVDPVDGICAENTEDVIDNTV